MPLLQTSLDGVETVAASSRVRQQEGSATRLWPRRADSSTGRRSRWRPSVLVWRERGYVPPKRRRGEVHTFAFIPRVGWHGVLYGDLAKLGPVTEFDYVGIGYQPQEFFRRDRRAAVRRREMNERALVALREAQARRPVDWVFVYASGLEVRAEWIRAIVDELRLPVVNMCLDDKQSWEGTRLDGQRLGQIDIAAEFDVCWTSAAVACEWYLCEGARPLYLPEGFDASTYAPRYRGTGYPGQLHRRRVRLPPLGDPSPPPPRHSH